MLPALGTKNSPKFVELTRPDAIGKFAVVLMPVIGVTVDVLTPNALPDKFRATVLAEASPV